MSDEIPIQEIPTIDLTNGVNAEDPVIAPFLAEVQERYDQMILTLKYITTPTLITKLQLGDVLYNVLIHKAV